MNHFLKGELVKVKGLSHIVSIPIEEFGTIQELQTFVMSAKPLGIGVVIHYETSNFHCGVMAQVYDKETCQVKEYIDR